MTLSRPQPPSSATATLAPSSRGLKLIVVGMGVLILVGLAILGAALFQRSQGALSGSNQGFGTASIALPPGAAIAVAATEGNRLILRAHIAPDHEELIIIDLRTGQESGRIALRWTASASR